MRLIIMASSRGFWPHRLRRAPKACARLADFTFKRVKPPAAGRKADHRADRPGRTGAACWRAYAQGQERAEADDARPGDQARRGGRGAAGAGARAQVDLCLVLGQGAAGDRRRARAVSTLALAALSQGPDGSTVRAPRMQHMQEVADKYGTEILKATLDTEVSPALVLAVIGIESAGRADAVSSAGAVGLMQLIPATAERFGVTQFDRSGAEHQGRRGLSGLADEASSTATR